MGDTKKSLQLVPKGNKKLVTQTNPIEVTQEMIQKKVHELCKMLESYEGGRESAAAYACFEIVAYSSCSQFEALGILADTMAEYKKTSDEIAEEEGETK
uniref:Uncharacterized protein n=1 Tax=viral metagenome TaxID=1070528 RepID=A0A6M3M959_9ZZZZ